MAPLRTSSLALASVLAATAAAPASADMRLEYDDGKNGTMSVSVASGRAALDSNGALMLHQEGTEAVVIVDHGRKAYTVMDTESTQAVGQQRSQMQQQMAQALKELESQLATMPAQQRATLEKMLAERTAAMQPDAPAKERTAKRIGTQTVGAYECTAYQILEDAKVVQEMCVVSPSDLGVSGSDFKTLRSTMKALATMAKQMGANASDLGDLERVNGIPVQVKVLDAGHVSTLKRVSTSKIAPESLAVPEDYRRQDFGQQ